MIFIYKSGGDWSKDGKSYTADAVSFHDLDFYLENGWHRSLDDALSSAETEPETKPETPEEGSEYEAELRAKIKALNGKPAGRSSIEFLEKQLAQLEESKK